jgi:ABC-type amino acid transport system permease subunit
MTVIDILLRYRQAFMGGLRNTMALAGIAWFLGLTVGIPLGALARRYVRWVGYPLHAVSFAIAAIPPIVLLYWAHFPLQTAFKIVIDPFVTASTILSFLNVVVVAQIVRSALDNFRDEYRLAAQVSGMTRREIFRFVELPLIAREVLPSILASQVLILQSTIFASLISVPELFRVAQLIDSKIYQPIQIYSALAVFFLVVCLPVYLIAFLLRQRFLRNLSEK